MMRAHTAGTRKHAAARTLSALVAAALLAAGALPLAAQTTAAAPRTWPALSEAATVFVDVSVLPMDQNRVLEHQTVVVSGGRIIAMGPMASTLVPAGATLINGRGKFLMPGLVDMHVHFAPGGPTVEEPFGRQNAMSIAQGVTTLRGLVAPPGFLNIRERALRGEIATPALVVAGPSINGNSVQGVNTARAVVMDQKAAGYDLLKTHGGLSREVYDTVVATAAREGIALVGHVTPGYGLARAVEARQQIEHLDGIIEYALPEGTPVPLTQFLVQEQLISQVNMARVREAIALMKAANICSGPTLSLFQTITGPATPDELAARPELRYIPRPALAQWRAEKANFLAQMGGPGAARFLALRDSMTRGLYEAGAKVITSSDSPGFFGAPGFSMHREMDALEKAGIPPYGVLEAATRNGAECLGQGSEFGTVAVGKRADLLLLDANPLQGRATMLNPAGVMLRGRWIPAAELQQMREGVAAAVAKIP